MRPWGSGGAGASAALALLDDVPASPASHRLASAPAALGTRPIVLSPRAASYEAPHIVLCRIRSRRLSDRLLVRNPEISPDCQTNSRPENTFLTTAVFVLGKTIPAIHRTVFSGLERNFTLLFAVRTDRFMHLSRTSVVSSILKSHVISPLMVLRITDWGYANKTIT